MTSCTESGQAISGNILVACHVDDPSKKFPLSRSLLDAIPQSERSTRKRTVASGGICVAKGRIVGADGNERIICEPVTDFLFSIEEWGFRRILPRTAANYPRPAAPRFAPAPKSRFAAFDPAFANG
ncbi:MAG TPA: hypothetical protein VFQ72_02130 [Candidatus Paceibacterota bacterium]|nr:hypothetical protein [Candidatus Paceibacterota bacterium]